MASQMAPQGCARTEAPAPWAIQDGPKIVLVRSFFRLVVRDRFFGRLGLLLGPFLGAPGVVLVLFRCSTHRFNPSTHQLVDSTHQPMALRHLLTRPGGLRAARLNILFPVAFLLFPLHFSTRNLPKPPRNSLEHPLKSPSKNPLQGSRIDYSATRVYRLKRTSWCRVMSKTQEK